MSKTTVEKIIIAVIAPLIVFGLLSFFTNIGNAASKDELISVKSEMEEYTDKAVEDHKENESIKFQSLEESIKKLLEWQEFTYLRELEKYDKTLYLIELEKINSAKLNVID